RSDLRAIQRLDGASTEPVTVRPPPTTTEQSADEPIAIIGMSGRFPQARDIGEMWNILAAGEHAVEEIPADRFDWREIYGDPAADPYKTNGKWCGCIPGVAEFDPAFFEVTRSEARTMDPRQRHLLQEAWKALEDAGYGQRHVQSHRIGIFVGVEEGDYGFVSGDGNVTSNHTGILASRLAYFLNLNGPAMAINTACSSSLVAAHQAIMSLRTGECDTAIVGGVNFILTPGPYVAMGQAGMLSPDGTCAAFDTGANGMVPGEAVAVVVLTRLSQAEVERDPIHAVIRAGGVNYDGKTNGITAPSGVAQTELLQSVYERYGIDPERLGYIVTHGTGTRLGDPVEINALYDAFKAFTQKQNFCALTSTKSNFGHTFAASGLVSLISLVEALKHETIPASLHCEEPSDYIQWAESPFYVNRESRPWPSRPGQPRMGAVSAFGMSGTNAHLVVEEVGAAADETTDALPIYLLALSARTEA
ncbi:MAG: polyketide synthase, partial [Verrucomicrobiota bacterium]